jgi:hypothetical protein
MSSGGRGSNPSCNGKLTAHTVLRLLGDNRYIVYMAVLPTCVQKKGTTLSLHMACKDAVAVKRFPEQRKVIDW